MSCNAGRATNGKIPISKPSNIQPRKAARSTSHWPRASRFNLAVTEFAVSVAFRMTLQVLAVVRRQTRRGINDETRMANDERNPKSERQIMYRAAALIWALRH